LWAAHNEHRILVPRVTFIIFNQIVGWNPVAIMVLSWSIVAGTALFLFQRLAAVFDFSKKRLWLALVGLCFLALFSPIQRENWLWAFAAIVWFFVQAGVILSLFTVSCLSMNFAIRLALAIFFAIVASLSAAQGLMALPALIIAVLLTKATRRQKLVAVLMLCIGIAILYSAYFTNYHPPSIGLTLHEILRKPRTLLFYPPGLLGAPLAFWAPDTFRLPLAVIAGCVLLLVFCLFSCLILRKGRQAEAAPWIGLACFSLAFCATTTVGRAFFGIESAAVCSRYTTHTLLFAMAVLALGYLAFDAPGRSKFSAGFLSIVALFFAIGTGILGGYGSELLEGAPEKYPRLLAQRLLPFLPYFDPKTDGLVTGPFFALCPAPNLKIFDWGLKPYAELGYVQTPTKVKFLGSANGLKGRYTIAGNTDLPTADLSVSGTIQCESSLSPDLVFLKDSDQDRFVAATDLVADSTSDQEKVYKWQLDLSAQFLPRKGEELEMWVYNKPANAFSKVASHCDNKLISDMSSNWRSDNSGECIVDATNGEPFTGEPIQINRFLCVQGWAAVAPENGIAADEVFVALAGDDGSLRVTKAKVAPRPDVNAYYKHPEMGPTGFQAVLDCEDIKTSSKLEIYLKRNNQLFACPTAVLVRP
jgi:hypothetical protein